MSLDRPQGGGGGGTLVTLHIYDLTRGIMSRHNDKIFGEQVDGMWHTGVSVYGREYFFEGGITSVPSGRSRFGKPKGPYNRREVMGYTDLLKPEFEKWVRARERERYGKLGYHLVDKNCNHFTDEAVRFLTGRCIPEDILRLPKLVRTSAIGRLFAPQVDRFFEGWQWMMLKTHWKYRRRLDAQWKNHLQYVEKHPERLGEVPAADEFTKHRKYIDCYYAPKSDQDHFVNVADEAGKRRLRVVGRPPSRVYLFGPGDDDSLKQLISRLQRAFDRGPHSESVSHQAGFAALCDRITNLPTTTPRAAYANIDSANPAVPAEPAITEPELDCLIWMLSPLIALWRVVVLQLEHEGTKKKHRDDTSDAPTSMHDAAEELSKYEGKGHYFATKLGSPKLLQDAFRAHKDDYLCILDAISRLCLEPSMGKTLIRGHLFTWQADKLFEEKDEPPSGKVLRKLLLGDSGLVGCNCRDFEDLPVGAQILVLRAFCNIFGAHPSLGRLVALSMSTGSKNRTIETLGLRARQALQNKECTMLRLTAVSLMCNVVCNLNKELARAPPPTSAPPSRPPPTASRPKTKPPQKPPGTSPAPRAPTSPLPQQTISAPRPTLTPGHAPPSSAPSGNTPSVLPPPILDASSNSLDRSLGTLKATSSDLGPGSDDEATESESGESSASKEASKESVVSESPEPTPPPHHEEVGGKFEPTNLTKLRTLIVRYLCVRLSFEKDATVQQRILTTMYHACLHSESARTQLASNPLTFAHAKRMPDLESRYLARLVEFMSRSNGTPPPEMHLTGPVVPPQWPELAATTHAHAPY